MNAREARRVAYRAAARVLSSYAEWNENDLTNSVSGFLELSDADKSRLCAEWERLASRLYQRARRLETEPR